MKHSIIINNRPVPFDKYTDVEEQLLALYPGSLHEAVASCGHDKAGSDALKELTKSTKIVDKAQRIVILMNALVKEDPVIKKYLDREVKKSTRKRRC